MHIFNSCLSAVYDTVLKKKRQSFLLSMAFLLAACSGTSLIGKDKTTTGIVVSHDTHIAQSGKHAFEKGGNAADAMAAMLVSGSVVMPSRVGLGAGGVCQILNPKIGRVETLDFLSVPMSFDRKIGTPSLLRLKSMTRYF